MAFLLNYPLLNYLYIAVKGILTALILFALFIKISGLLIGIFSDFPVMLFLLMIPSALYLLYFLPLATYRVAVSHL